MNVTIKITDFFVNFLYCLGFHSVFINFGAFFDCCCAIFR